MAGKTTPTTPTTPKKRRTTKEIDAEARATLAAWEAEERKAGRDPDRDGAIGDLIDAEGANHPVVQAWWRIHHAAQRYG